MILTCYNMGEFWDLFVIISISICISLPTMSRITRFSSRRDLKPEIISQSKVPTNISNQIKQYQQCTEIRIGSGVVNKSENKKSQVKDSALCKEGANQKTGRKSVRLYQRQKIVEKQIEKPEIVSTNCVFEGQWVNKEGKYIQEIVKYLCGSQTAKEQYSQCGESQEETNGKRERVSRQKLRSKIKKSKRIEKEHNGKRSEDEEETGKKRRRFRKNYQITHKKAKDKQIIQPRHKKVRSVAEKIQQIIHLCCPNVNQNVARDYIQNFATIKAIQVIVSQVLKLITHKRQTEDKQLNETIEWGANKQPMSRYYKYLKQQHLPLFIKLTQINIQPEYRKKSKQIFQQNKSQIRTSLQTNEYMHGQIKRQIQRQGPEQIVAQKQKYNQMGVIRSDMETQKMESQSFLLDVLGNFQFVRFGNHDWIQELEE